MTRPRNLVIGLLLLLAVTLSACGSGSKDPQAPGGSGWDSAN